MSAGSPEPQSSPDPQAARLSIDGDIWNRLPPPLSGAVAILAAAGTVTVATIIGSAVIRLLPAPSVSLVYLCCVVLVAILFGTWTGVATAALSFLAYNFFFIPPIYTFVIADPQELFALIVFLVVALLTGSLAGRMREVADAARRRSLSLLSLNDFAAMLSGARTAGAIFEALASQVAMTVQGNAIVLIETAGGFETRAAVPTGAELTTADMQAAGRARRSGHHEPAAAPGWPGATYEFCPLTSDRGVIAVVGLRPGNGQRALQSQDQATVSTILQHAAIAIERIRFEAEGAAARDEAEREHIRSTLLSSLSHDLRTPLASILGAVTSLRQLGDDMPAGTRADLLLAIEEETRRMSQFVGNLLDLTRLEAQPPDLRRDLIDVAELTQVAVSRARHLFEGRKITITAVSHVPQVRGDAMLFEHVIINLIDNAVKYSEPAAPITIAVAADNEHVELTVADRGRGIPPDQIEAVFEKFYRVRAGDGDTQGTGLGLTICKRVVEHMGGTIRAESPVSGKNGTRIVITLPLVRGASEAAT